jgi:hypothetical protein
LEGTKLQALSYCPSKQLLQQFWKLCEYRLSAPGRSCSPILLVLLLKMSWFLGLLLFEMFLYQFSQKMLIQLLVSLERKNKPEEPD